MEINMKPEYEMLINEIVRVTELDKQKVLDEIIELGLKTMAKSVFKLLKNENLINN